MKFNNEKEGYKVRAKTGCHVVRVWGGRLQWFLFRLKKKTYVWLQPHGKEPMEKGWIC